MTNPELTHRPSKLDQKAKALAQAMQPRSGTRPSAARKMARGLGWFSIGLGLLEVLATRRVAGAVGLRGQETLVRACGMREIASGVSLLASGAPRAACASTWTRVAGDAMDLALVGAAVGRSRARAKAEGGHPMLALLALAGVAMLDAACARALHQEADAADQRTDYSDRVGFPAPPERMRGAALENFRQPGDMRMSPQRDAELLH